MCDGAGQIVRSIAGHDRGNLFCVVAAEGEFLLLADGKRRRAASPKRKKRCHVAVLSSVGPLDLASDRDLRQRLAIFREQGGN